MGHFADRQAINLHAFRAHGFAHRVANSASRIVIFDGDNRVVGSCGRFQQRVGIDGSNTEEIDDANGNALLLEDVVGLQSFC